MSTRVIHSFGLIAGILFGSRLLAQDGAGEFIRGDANGDRHVTLTDVSYALLALFTDRAPGLTCSDAADVDNDGQSAAGAAALGDALYLLRWLFGEGPEPPAPFAEPGPDLGPPDPLDCDSWGDAERLPDPAYRLEWSYPQRVNAGQQDVEFFLVASSSRPIECLALSSLVNSGVLENVTVDLEDTVFPAALREDFSASPWFVRREIPLDAAPPFDVMLLVGAVFLDESSGFLPIDLPAVGPTGGLEGARLLRVVADIREDAPASDETVTVLDPLGGPNLPPFAAAALETELGSGSTAVPVEAMRAGVTIDSGEFLRGDPNADGTVDISDPIRVLSFLYLGASVDCRDAADVDDNGEVEVTDAIFSLSFLFRGGPPPEPPMSGCAKDPSPDSLLCIRQETCG